MHGQEVQRGRILRAGPRRAGDRPGGEAAAAAAAAAARPVGRERGRVRGPVREAPPAAARAGGAAGHAAGAGQPARQRRPAAVPVAVRGVDQLGEGGVRGHADAVADVRHAAHGAPGQRVHDGRGRGGPAGAHRVVLRLRRPRGRVRARRRLVVPGHRRGRGRRVPETPHGRGPRSRRRRRRGHVAAGGRPPSLAAPVRSGNPRPKTHSAETKKKQTRRPSTAPTTLI